MDMNFWSFWFLARAHHQQISRVYGSYGTDANTGTNPLGYTSSQIEGCRECIDTKNPRSEPRAGAYKSFLLVTAEIRGLFFYFQLEFLIGSHDKGLVGIVGFPFCSVR